MTDELLALLKTVDTPTVCNAIEVAEGGRGFSAFTRGSVVPSSPAAPPMVGYAVTAHLRGQTPPDEPVDTVRARRMDYYRSIAEAPRPAVAVLEDTDWPECVGAFWGEINTTVHRGFGVAGVLTNGVMRDLGDLPDGFPVIAGSIGPSHAFVHVTAIGEPVTVFGLTVAPGALIHADRHGALAIPSAVVPELGAAIGTLIETERIILDAARKPDFDFSAFEAAWQAFERART